jgi:hypothetical protein
MDFAGTPTALTLTPARLPVPVPVRREYSPTNNDSSKLRMFLRCTPAARRKETDSSEVCFRHSPRLWAPCSQPDSKSG